MSQELHVALASDAKYYPGLLVAATSVAFHAAPDTSLVLHVLDGGLSDSNWQRLVTTIGRVNSAAGCRRIPVHRASLGRFRDNGRKSPMVYARLLLPEHVNARRVVYIDCDFLVLADLTVANTWPMADNAALAVVDPMVGILGNDCPWLPAPGLDAASPYFNSGFMVIDLDAWRQFDLAFAVWQALEARGEACTYWDQTALNYVLAGRVGLIDRAWNYPNRAFALGDAAGTARAIHYLDRCKPWLRAGATDAQALWRSFAQNVAGLSSRELPWRVRCQEILATLMQRGSPLLARWYEAQLKLGRRAAEFPARHWREVAPTAHSRPRLTRQQLQRLQQEWSRRRASA